ncbi:MAG: hypothetical protein LBV28_00875, partial [Puniceicoccales bacterium]|nr:hypothetical protein [Puniceicoccales bacterium]
MKIFFLSFSLVTASLCALCGTARAIEIADLRVEHLTNPLGIDAETPRFSWKLRDPDATRAQRQTAYHILVASTPEKLANGTGDIWDSGLVASAESYLVPFGGAAAKLQSGAVFHWKVLARDNAGKASA